MYVFIYFSLVVYSSYYKNYFHKMLQNFEGGTILNKSKFAHELDCKI